MAVGVLNILNAVAVGAAMGVGLVKWDGHSVSDVSDQFRTLLTPIGWVFGIWAVIYSFLLSFVAWQLWPANQESAPVKAIGPWLIVAGALQTLWIPSWCYENMTLAAVLDVSIWVALLNLNLSMIHANLYPRDPSAAVDPSTGRRTSGFLFSSWRQTPSFQQILARLPFGFWFGWITLAATVNATIFFQYVEDVPFFASSSWASLALTGAAAFGLFWSVITVDFVFPIPAAWGALGIAAKEYNPEVTQVALTVSLTVFAFTAIHAAIRLVVAPALNRSWRRSEFVAADEEMLLEDMRKVTFIPTVQNP